MLSGKFDFQAFFKLHPNDSTCLSELLKENIPYSYDNEKFSVLHLEVSF